MTEIYLPFPPTVNGLYSGKARRFKSKAYLRWILEAKADLAEQKYYKGFEWKSHKGKVQLVILLKAPDKRRRDCSNYVKAVEDFLVQEGVIMGDDSRFVDSVFVCWKPNMLGNCFVVIQDCP